VKPKGRVALSLVVLVAGSIFLVLQLHRVLTAEGQGDALPRFTWEQSLPIAWRDPQIGAIGGTEVRSLIAFDGKLFAGIGYWMDSQSESPALPGAQVLRLDTSNSEWQVDLELRDRTPADQRLYLAISTLRKVHFTTDRSSGPTDLLIASAWKRGAGLDVFWRSAGSDTWLKTKISDQASGTQIRAFAVHRDQATGDEILFAGATNAIFVGKFDGTGLAWNSLPEWHEDITDFPSAAARVASLTECNGKLYATAHDAIYERSDGAVPRWNKVFETTIYVKNNRVTGLRGLTCIRDSSGSPDVLLVGVEDNPARIYRIEPTQLGASGRYKSTLELDVSSFLTRELGMQTTYAIVAYNDMTEYRYPEGICPHMLMGLEAITPQAPNTFGPLHFNSDGYYLSRNCHGKYTLHQIRDIHLDPQPWLVSVRTFALSPFHTDPPGTVYAGGFDTNYTPVHNTAWLYKGVPGNCGAAFAC
jgi:hypothetical protein